MNRSITRRLLPEDDDDDDDEERARSRFSTLFLSRKPSPAPPSPPPLRRHLEGGGHHRRLRDKLRDGRRRLGPPRGRPRGGKIRRDQGQTRVLSDDRRDSSGIGAALTSKGGTTGRRHVRRRWVDDRARGESAKVGKSVNVTSSSSSPVTVATLRLKPGTSARSRWTSRARDGRRAATVAAEFSVHHNSGAAPEPSVGGPRRAPAWFARRSAWGRLRTTGTLTLSSCPTISGAGVEKDFAVKAFTADAGSGNAPALATASVVARVTGDFVSLT